MSGRTWVSKSLGRAAGCCEACCGGLGNSVQVAAVYNGMSHGTLHTRSNQAPFTGAGRPVAKYKSVNNATARNAPIPRKSFLAWSSRSENVRAKKAVATNASIASDKR